MLSGFRDLAKKLIAKHNSFGKFCQLCCCCCFSEDPLLGKDVPDDGGGGGSTPADLGGGEEPPKTPGRKTPHKTSPSIPVSARGSPRVGGGDSTGLPVVNDGQQPGPSMNPDVTTRHGTPLSTRQPVSASREPTPALSTTQEDKGGGDTTGESGDVGFIEADEEPLSIAGKVLVSFTYMPNANKLNLTVVRVADLPPVARGGADMVRIHLCVLPMRNQRFKTKNQSASQGVFNQTFQFVHMTKDLLESCAIRLRVYGKEGFVGQRLIGEAKIALIKIDLTSPLSDGDMWKNLAPKGEVVSLFFPICCIFIILFICLESDEHFQSNHSRSYFT